MTSGWMQRPDRRYWRSRANRRVRKARMTRSVTRWSVVVVAHLAVLTAIAYVVTLGARRLTTSPEFSIARIQIEGTRRTSVAAFERALSPYIGRNLLDLSLDDVAARARAHAWVRRASAKRILPDTLRVTIEERTPAAIAVIEGVPHVIDQTGHDLGPSGPGLADDLPVLTGLGRSGDRPLDTELERGVRLLGRLERATGPWVASVSDIDLSRWDRIEVRTVDPGPTLWLDPDQVERNVREYLELRSEIVRRVGPLEYVDLRWRDRISTKPVSQVIQP